MLNYNFLNKEMIPYQIEARIRYPKRILNMLKEWKEKEKPLNNEDSFLNIKDNTQIYHAGFIELTEGKKVKLKYYSEGNWFTLDTAEMNTLPGASSYYYNFEQNYIKPSDLEEVSILEWYFPNKDNDGIAHSIYNTFKKEVFQLSFNLNEKFYSFLIKDTSLDTVIAMFKTLTSNYPMLNIEKSYYDENSLELLSPKKTKLITGQLKVSDVARKFNIENNNNSNYVDFKIVAKSIF